MADLFASLRLFVLSQLVCCVVYPAVVWSFARVAAPEKQAGSLLRTADGTIVGSRLVAQKFTRPEYFWPRPSAVEYAADAAGGSNLSPANPVITERAEPIIARLGGTAERPVPADLVTASGSGLDPHVTLAAAEYQVPRVAAARSMSEDDVQRVIRDAAEELPLSGGTVVNILELNLALDAAR
jgi:K+-transporting ATPase ATPase C chain